MYPLALEALTGDKISVGPPYFNAIVLPIMCLLFLVLPFGQSLAWKRGDLLGAAQRLLAAIGLSLAAILVLFAWHGGGPVAAPLGFGLGVFLVTGSASEIAGRAWHRGVPLRVAFRRAIGLPRQTFGSAVAHAGLGLTVMGIAATAWHVETITLMRPGEVRDIAGYTLALAQLVPVQGPNYRETAATFMVSEAGIRLGDLTTTKRIYTVRGTPTTQVGLMTMGLGQLYASLGDSEPDGQSACVSIGSHSCS